MSEKNIEMMKKLIEAKKEKGNAKGSYLRATSNMGTTKKAKKNKKTGGLFDK
jgi:hypothetical protein